MSPSPVSLPMSSFSSLLLRRISMITTAFPFIILTFLQICCVASLGTSATSNTHSDTKIMSSSKQINNVVVAIAMEAEAKPFIEHLNLIQEDSFFSSKTPFLAYRGEHHSCQITVITNGKDTVHGMGVDNVGTVPAALATFLALEKLNSDKDNDSKNSNNVCDLVINAGTCGGFQRKGAEIGDVFFTTAVANHDRRIPLGPFEPYGVGKIESMDVSHLAEAIGAKLGVCTTGNSLDAHDIDDHHMKVNDASVKDMEAAAIAWSCQLHGTPYVGLKVVTDIVDGDKPTQEEFMENLGTAAKSLQEALPKVIEQVCGSKRDEL